MTQAYKMKKALFYCCFSLLFVFFRYTRYWL